MTKCAICSEADPAASAHYLHNIYENMLFTKRKVKENVK